MYYGYGFYKPYVEEILPYLDHIVAPAKFFTTRDQLFGSEPNLPMYDLLDKFRPQSVVMTNGEHGGWFLFPGMDNIGCYPALNVRSIDTCGAGDAFHGAFAYGISQKWPLSDVILFFSWAAGRKCTEISNETLPREEDITQWRQEIEAVAARWWRLAGKTDDALMLVEDVVYTGKPILVIGPHATGKIVSRRERGLVIEWTFVSFPTGAPSRSQKFGNGISGLSSL